MTRSCRNRTCNVAVMVLTDEGLGLRSIQHKLTALPRTGRRPCARAPRAAKRLVRALDGAICPCAWPHVPMHSAQFRVLLLRCASTAPGAACLHLPGPAGCVRGPPSGMCRSEGVPLERVFLRACAERLAPASPTTCGSGLGCAARGCTWTRSSALRSRAALGGKRFRDKPHRVSNAEGFIPSMGGTRRR